MDKYLIKYLADTAETELSGKYLDYFKAELDWQIYVSETHMSQAYQRNREISLRERLLRIYQYAYAMLIPATANGSGTSKVLSTVFFPNKEALNHVGISLYSPVWHPVGKSNIYGDLKTLLWHQDIQKRIRNDDFDLFLKNELHEDLEKFQEHLVKKYRDLDFKALFLYTDQYFYSKYGIEIFNKLDRPSLIFTHGMPGIYSLEVDNRADYLMVWSEKIRKNYVKAGFEASKLKVVGHPRYSNLAKQKSLRSDLSDVLVIPVSSVTWHQHEYDNPVVNDTSMVVLYLYKVQRILKKLGVKKARYRSHPSINQGWIHAFLDKDFYTFDLQPLTDSLDRSSLVIGANSTVLLESLIRGVNYIAFDPKHENGINMSGYKAVPPFDGSEEKLILSNDEEELEQLLKSNHRTEYSLVHDYIEEFDLSVLNELIEV